MTAEHPHPADSPDDHHGPSNFISKYVFSRDHKIIGIQFLFSSLAWLFVAGGLALAVRWRLQHLPVASSSSLSPCSVWMAISRRCATSWR